MFRTPPPNPISAQISAQILAQSWRQNPFQIRWLLRTLSLALCLGLAAPYAMALGLGSMRTQSALNQPFYAEIDLFDVETDELDTVKPRLASREDFADAGAERPHFLTRLRFTPMIGPAGQSIIQVTSREPIREPYLDFLIEVLWPEGRMVKEYTVLMDPPSSSSRPAPRVTAPSLSQSAVSRAAVAPTRRPPPQPAQRAPAPAPAPTQRAQPQAQSRPQPRTETPTPTSTPTQAQSRTRGAAAPRPVSSEADAIAFPLRYGPVPSGSGLWRVARRLAPPGATLEQTAMALYRNNQDAFVRGNINVLKVRSDLSIPSAEELFALDPETAERQFQDAMAGRDVPSQPITDVPVEPELRIAAAPAGAASDVPGMPAAMDSGAPPENIGDLEDDLLRVRETSESNRQETTELRDRILELEQQLTDIRRLLELRNEQLAQMQRGLGEPAMAEVLRLDLPNTGEVEVTASDATSPQRELLPRGPAEQAGALTAGPPELQPLEQQSTNGDAERSGAPDAELKPRPASSAMPEQQAVEKPGSSVAMEQPSAYEGEQSAAGPFGFVMRIIRSIPLWAVASGLGVLVLVGLALLLYRRRRQLAESDAQPTDVERDELEPNMAVVGPDVTASSPPHGGVQIKEAVEEDSMSIDLDMLSDTFAESTPELDPEFNPELDPEIVASMAADSASSAAAPRTPVRDSDFNFDVQTGLPVNVASNMVHGASPDTQEVEVLAEADIYILYGRYREAESILLEALAHSPARADLRFKLAESFIGSGNRDALAKLVEQMKASGEYQLDAAKWASIEQGLSAMAPVAGQGGSEPPSPGGSPANTSQADSPDSAGVTLDIGAVGKGKLGSDDFRDSEDSGLGFSVREVSPSSAGRLNAQMEDLELDLQDLDDLGSIGKLGTDSGSLPGDSASAPVAASDLELPDEPTPEAESRAEAGLSTNFEDDLDLDLDALDKLANLDEATQPPETTQAVSDLETADFGDDKKTEPLADPTLDSSMSMEDSISSDALSSQWRADSGLWDEAATKMDLARAYIEMEDSDAARAILEEVVQEGSADQQAEANALLAKIG